MVTFKAVQCFRPPPPRSIISTSNQRECQPCRRCLEGRNHGRVEAGAPVERLSLMVASFPGRARYYSVKSAYTWFALQDQICGPGLRKKASPLSFTNFPGRVETFPPDTTGRTCPTCENCRKFTKDGSRSLTCPTDRTGLTCRLPVRLLLVGKLSRLPVPNFQPCLPADGGKEKCSTLRRSHLPPI